MILTYWYLYRQHPYLSHSVLSIIWIKRDLHGHYHCYQYYSVTITTTVRLSHPYHSPSIAPVSDLFDLKRLLRFITRIH
jgi:hypothetical protein